MKLTKARKRTLIFSAFATVIVLVCIILIATFCGFTHEPKQYRTLLMTSLFVVIFNLFIWEPVRFIVLAVDHASWPSVDHRYTSEVGAQPSHFTYLKTRLNSRRSEVLITKEHRNEALNQKYKLISSDLWLYGSYFLALLICILVFEDQSLYYTTTMMDRLFRVCTATTMGLSKIYFQYQIYPFFTITLVEAFNANIRDHGHDGWYAMEQWKMLGAIRLRQLRTTDKNFGWGKPKWDQQSYAPEWKLPYQHFYFEERFWRIFEPFKPMEVEPSLIDGLLLNFNHFGEVVSYPELVGYVALMMRTLVSTRKQVNYLLETKWLDRKTVALFIDFSLYNMDGNALAIITLRVENTPFGTQLTNVEVDCVRILGASDNVSWYQPYLLAIYLILVLQFMRGLVKRLWYDPASIKQLWNLVDLFICLLNGFLLTLYLVRELLTHEILEMVRTATLEQYLGMQRLLRLHHSTNITMGLLVCITTMRLWKVLQFASVFQHFTQTLFHAWKSVVSLGVVIMVVLMGLGIGLAVPNGNNTVIFQHVLRSVITCLWYSVGHTESIEPKNFFYGGVLIGMLMFLLLVFLVAILLLNVFASVIYYYMNSTRRMLKEQQKAGDISFWQFLQAEYGEVVRRFLPCFFQQKKYYRRKLTVSQNVAMELNRQEDKELLRSRGRYYKPKPRLTDEEQHVDYLRRVERLISLSAVLEVQMELLERYLLGDEYGNIPTPPESNVDFDIYKWTK